MDCLILIIRRSQIGSSFETFSIQYLVRVLKVDINVATGENSQIGSSFETFSIQYLVRVLKVDINVATGENRMHIKKNEMKKSVFQLFVKLFRYLRSTLSQNG